MVPGGGRQQTFSGKVASGGKRWHERGAGFSGKVQIAYTVQDSAGRTSNPATLLVTVKPSPTAPILLYSFETGSEGWAPGNWQTNAGTVAQSTAFHTDGNYGLQVVTADGGWFGLDINQAVDLTGKTHFKFDLQTTNAGTSKEVALKLGDSWTWCEGGGWGWTNSNTTTTIDIDMLNLGCANPDFSKLHGIYIWFSGGGTFYIDNVRGE